MTVTKKRFTEENGKYLVGKLNTLIDDKTKMEPFTKPEIDAWFVKDPEITIEFTSDTYNFEINGVQYTADKSPYEIKFDELEGYSAPLTQMYLGGYGVPWKHNNTLTSVTYGEGLDLSQVTSYKTEHPVSGYPSAGLGYCDSLTTLDVSALNTSNVTDMSSMFSSCSGLTSLNLSNFDTSKVTDMHSVFHGCGGLTSLDVSNFNTSNVTNMGSMFYWCNSLTSLDVSNFNTSNVTNMGSMFSGCSGLTSLNLSNFDTSKVTSINGTFGDCRGLTTLDVSNFNTSNVTDMGFMFQNCTGLTSLNLSNFDTSNVTYMENMFLGCSSLTKIKVANCSQETKDKLIAELGNTKGSKLGTWVEKGGYLVKQS